VSSALRISIIMVLAFASLALGMIAYNTYMPKPTGEVAVAGPAPVTTAYLVAARPLQVGTLTRDDDFESRTASSANLPAGAVLDTPTAKLELRGALVRKYIDAGHAVTPLDLLRPRDRGFLASVLAPDTRAISINVDAESGVSGLIWPGDYVDIVMTQVNNRSDVAGRSHSEIVLRNVRIVAIDQELAVGPAGTNTAAGKVTHAVSLQLTPEQVKKITLAKDLGKLSLAIRSAVEQNESVDAGATYDCDVSPELARQNEAAQQSEAARRSATVVVFSGDKAKEYQVKRHDRGGPAAVSGCNGAMKAAQKIDDLASVNGEKAKN
jgi:pilus assembly protein CpaB